MIDALLNINRFDLLVVLFCFGMFVLGFVQGTIRRVLGLASMLFSFLFAANLREPLGADEKSLAWRLVFHARERTLTEAEIESAVAAITPAVARIGGRIRT